MIRIYSFLSALLIFLSLNLYAQVDTIANNTINNDKVLNYKDAQIIMVLKKDKVPIDTIIVKKINPDWIDKLEVIRFEKAIISEVSTKTTILIYIKRKNVKKAREIIQNTNMK